MKHAQSRLLQLDLLRGIAIILVMGRHAVIDPRETGRMIAVSGPWARFGWTGVDLFFVLSGFLIGGLLFKEIRERQELRLVRFWIRRDLKLWPSYAVYMLFVACVLLAQTRFDTVGVFHRMLPNLLQLQNYLGTPRLQTWSLAVEEHFYFLLPLLLVALMRVAGPDKGMRAVPWIAGGLMILCTSLRAKIAFTGNVSGEDILQPTHLRADSLFTGVLLAYLYHYHTDALRAFCVRNRWALLIGGALLVAPMVILRVKTSMFVPSFGVMMLYFGYGAILLALVHTPVGDGPIGRVLASKPAHAVALLGAYSYPVYLWHFEISQFLFTATRNGFLFHLPAELRWLAVMAIYIPVSLAVGIALSRLVEYPTLKLRDRIIPGPSGALPEEKEKKFALRSRHTGAAAASEQLAEPTFSAP